MLTAQKSLKQKYSENCISVEVFFASGLSPTMMPF
jgi:hypothetical protein